MSKRRSKSYIKFSNKRSKTKEADPTSKFMRDNRKILVQAGIEDPDNAYGMGTAAKTGKRVRELIREFPDFYYAPGKKKFLVDDAHYDMVCWDMQRMPIIVPDELSSNNAWLGVLKNLNDR